MVPRVCTILSHLSAFVHAVPPSWEALPTSPPHFPPLMSFEIRSLRSDVGVIFCRISGMDELSLGVQQEARDVAPHQT